MSNCPNK